MNRIPAICMAAMLLTTTQSPICISCSAAKSQDHASVEPGMFWTLSSRWRWHASGVADHAGWRVETEDWNDTLTIQEVSGDELTFRLKRVGQGVLEANGSFVIGGRVRDSWTIDREYSLRVNTTTFRDADGRPVRWVSNVKELEASRSMPQMWIDKDYHNVEVQFRVSGSDRLSLGGVVFDTWIVSYSGLTAGYWSAEGNHSIGFKEEDLEYDQTCGLLLRDTYRGIYGMKTGEGGWNETETYAATAINANFPLFGGVESRNLTNGVIMAGALLAAGIAVLVIIHRRRLRPSEQPDTNRGRFGGVGGPLGASSRMGKLSSSRSPFRASFSLRVRFQADPWIFFARVWDLLSCRRFSVDLSSARRPDLRRG